MLAWLTARMGRALAVFGGVLAAILTALAVGRRSGAQEHENDQHEDNQKRQEAGRNAVAKEQAETDGLSKRDILDRMRRRDGDWRGL